MLRTRIRTHECSYRIPHTCIAFVSAAHTTQLVMLECIHLDHLNFSSDFTFQKSHLSMSVLEKKLLKEPFNFTRISQVIPSTTWQAGGCFESSSSLEFC